MASNLSIALMIGASVGGAMAGIKRLQNTLHTLRDSTLSTTAKLKSLAGTTALGLTGSISGIKATSGMVMNIADPAIKFESAMADVKKVVDFKSPEGFANLSKDILNLTRTLPMTAEELAAITASGGQLGVAEEDLKEFTTTIAKMSVAFDMSAQDSGDAMAKLANVYKIPIKDIGNLGDAINELSNSSPAKASDIVNTLGRIAGVSKDFGLTENAAAALANTFISLGKSPEVASTAINGMLTSLNTADKGGKKFQAALKEVGISAKQLKKNIAKDGQGAIVDFLKRVEKLPKAKRTGVLVDLFGKEYADDVSSIAGNVDLLEKSIKTLQDTDENGKASYLGSMGKEFAARAETTENGLQLLKNSVSEFWTTLGVKLLPVINNVAGKLGSMVHWVTDLITQNSWLADTLLYLGGAVAGVFTGFSALTAVIGGLSMSWVVMGKPILKTIGFIRTVLGWGRQLITLFSVLGVKVLDIAITFGKGLLMMSRALLANPIGLIITGIAVAAYLIYDNWEPISAWFANLWTNVTAYFQSFCTWVQGIWNGATEWVSSAWSGVSDYFGQLWDGITSFFDSGIGNITATILNWSPLGLFYQAFAGVLSWFGIDLPAKFTEFGSNLISGLVNGIRNAWEGAKQIVSDLGDGIKGWFAEKLGIHSPSRVFKGYGVNVVEGLAIGMDKAEPLALDASKNLSSAVKFAPVLNSIETAFKPILNEKKGFFGSLWDDIKFGANFVGNLLGINQPADYRTPDFNPNSSGQNPSIFHDYQPLNRNAVTNNETNQHNGIVVNFNPTIHVGGNQTQGVMEQVQQGLNMSLVEFERLLNRVLDQRQRRAY